LSRGFEKIFSEISTFFILPLDLFAFSMYNIDIPYFKRKRVDLWNG